jgi:pimeloyl-ACP methyl ester carboxylesterase
MQDAALMHVFYLHGFASSARSTKASFFAERLAPYGLTLHCPDFNEPEFEMLTVTRMIAQVEAAVAALPPGPVALIGSSLGGLVAVLAAERDRARAGRVDRLVLLAPALEFGANRVQHLGAEGLARWKAEGRLEVFHYGYGEPRAVRYALFEDAQRYDAYAAGAGMPVLVFQGLRDESVDPESVKRFAAPRPHVVLRLLDDDHQLLASLPVIWEETRGFLAL